MRAEKTPLCGRRVHAATLAALVGASALALGLSVFLAFPPRALTLSPWLITSLQIANVALSCLALTATTLAARRLRGPTVDPDAFITVCAWTRRVLWQGRWLSFEEYLARRFNLRCTHGISDEAAAKLRDDATKFGMKPQV